MPTPATHFLDALPFDYARPESRELLALLARHLYLPRDIVRILQQADVSLASIYLEQSAAALWHDAVGRARAQGRLRPLLQAITEHPDHADLAPRLRELCAARPAVEAARADETLRAGSWRDARERITGPQSTLLDVAFLSLGAERARAVVRVVADFGVGGIQYGTGFFIAPDLVLTNHHVLFHDDLGAAERVEVWIDYERDARGRLVEPTIVTGDAPSITGEPELDWAVVRLPDPRGYEGPVLPLGPQRPLQVGDRVAIIQHPLGGVKQVGLVHNDVRRAEESFIQYLTDTDHGSSGAPVFNERWEVVALHHLWDEVRGEDGRLEIRNQGVRIERVCERLRTRGLL
jgi:S1-C subfamily serine protease